ADRDRLVVAVTVARGGVDGNEAGDTAVAQLGAQPDVEQGVTALPLVHRQRERAGHRHQTRPDGPIVVVPILLPGYARPGPAPTEGAVGLPTQARAERISILLAEGHRRAAGAGLRPGVDLVLLVGHAHERPVNPVPVIEPVTAERARHEVRAVGRS